MNPEEEKMLEKYIENADFEHAHAMLLRLELSLPLFAPIFREYANFMNQIDEMIDNEY